MLALSDISEVCGDNLLVKVEDGRLTQEYLDSKRPQTENQATTKNECLIYSVTYLDILAT